MFRCHDFAPAYPLANVSLWDARKEIIAIVLMMSQAAERPLFRLAKAYRVVGPLISYS